jgi:hypothetical protein
MRPAFIGRRCLQELSPREEKHAPGYKPAKNHLTLLLCGNASGTAKLKPMLIHHSETPRVMKGLIKVNLLII